MKKLPKKPLYHIYGKRWFDRVNGNTYHSVCVTMQTSLKAVPIEIAEVKFAYGYDYAFEQTAIKELRKNWKLPENVFNAYGMRNNGYNMLVTVIDVNRKRDL